MMYIQNSNEKKINLYKIIELKLYHWHEEGLLWEKN